LTELQKDPITRSDFLGFGLLGTVVGAILTIPPVAFVLSPIIKTDVLGESNIDEGWQEVASVMDIPQDEPASFEIEFPIEQVYGNPDIQNQFPDQKRSNEEFTLKNAVWLSWKSEINHDTGQIAKVDRPAFLDQKSNGFSESEREELKKSINVLSNSCAHLGCPVRWLINTDGKGEFLCPCHGGLYDINGTYEGGPPPRDMYRYINVKIEEDGRLYVRHGYDIEPGLEKQQPYVV
jgi:Rieske Fe-S protein